MNETVLITGSSGGIGLELARLHAEHHDNLILIARNKLKLDELRDELEKKFSISVITIGKDITLPGAVDEISDEIRMRNLFVSILINNAGIGDIGLFAESDSSKILNMINLNITALTLLTKAFLPEMIARGNGRILNIASTAAFQAGPTMSVYFASKAYVLHFSEALHNEVVNVGVTVTALCPGSTESGFYAAAMRDSNRLKKRNLKSAREIAEYGYKSMMKGKRIAIPGMKNKIMIFSVRFIPRSLATWAARKIEEKKH